MKVRCISKLPNSEQAQLLGDHFIPGKQEFHLDIGREYIVFGLQILSGEPWIEILSDSGYLRSVPLCLFNIIDGHISKLWEIRYKDGFLTLWPAAFYDEYFFDDLIEGTEEIVDKFQKIRALIEKEANS